MTERLETVLEKFSTVPHLIDSSVVQEFYQFMVDNRQIAIKRIILRRLCSSAMNLLLTSPFTIFRIEKRYLNF